MEKVNPKEFRIPQSLIMVAGVPASGKSSLAKGIAASLQDAAYISKDLIQTPFTRTERVDGDTYAMVRGPAFRILVDFSDVQLSLGNNPVIDAPFSVNAWRGDEYSDWIIPFWDVARKHDVRLCVIRCMPPSVEELRRRIEARRYPWDEWKLAHWEEFLKREPPDFEIPHDDVLNVVTDRPVEAIVQEVLTGFLGACRNDENRKPS